MCIRAIFMRNNTLYYDNFILTKKVNNIYIYMVSYIT